MNVLIVPVLACVQQPRVEVRPAVRPEDRVFTRGGNVPILIAAPHGGDQAVPGVEPRQPRPGVITVRDDKTYELARTVATYFEQLSGGKPYAVFRLFGKTGGLLRR